MKRTKKKSDKRVLVSEVDIQQIQEYFICKKKDNVMKEVDLHKILRHFADMVRNVFIYKYVYFNYVY